MFFETIDHVSLTCLSLSLCREMLEEEEEEDTPLQLDGGKKS